MYYPEIISLLKNKCVQLSKKIELVYLLGLGRNMKFLHLQKE